MFIGTPCIKNVEDIIDTAVEMCQSLCRATTLQTLTLYVYLLRQILCVYRSESDSATFAWKVV